MQRQDRKRGVERLLRERERFRRSLNDTRGPGVPLLDHPPGRFNCNDSPVSRLICTGPCSHIHHGPGVAEPTHDRGSDPGVGLACGGIRATDPIVNSLAHSVNSVRPAICETVVLCVNLNGSVNTRVSAAALVPSIVRT
jgi:hypothetical protein